MESQEKLEISGAKVGIQVEFQSSITQANQVPTASPALHPSRTAVLSDTCFFRVILPAVAVWTTLLVHDRIAAKLTMGY